MRNMQFFSKFFFDVLALEKTIKKNHVKIYIKSAKMSRDSFSTALRRQHVTQ